MPTAAKRKTTLPELSDAERAALQALVAERTAADQAANAEAEQRAEYARKLRERRQSAIARMREIEDQIIEEANLLGDLATKTGLSFSRIVASASEWAQAASGADIAEPGADRIIHTIEVHLAKTLVFCGVPRVQMAREREAPAPIGADLLNMMEGIIRFGRRRAEA